MLNDEFLKWWNHAIACFSILHRLFPEGQEESRKRFKVWRAALANVRLDKAMQAVDAMHRGDMEPPKYDWDQFPAYVLRYCRDDANAELSRRVERYYDGPTVKCPHCQDSRSGLISIWNPRFLNECEDEVRQCQGLADIHDVYRGWRKRDDRNKYETLAIPCCCDSPGAVAKRSDGRRSFDPKKHCTSHTVRGLHEFLADTSRYEWEPNY